MRLKQISKRSLAILLTVLMVLSSLMVGTITTVNSATTDVNTSSALPTTVYLKPGEWDKDGAWFAAWVWKNGGSGSWVTLSKIETGVYSFNNSAGNDRVIFMRMASGATSPSWTQGNNGYWNRTQGDLTIPNSGYNCYSVTNPWGGNGATGSWSKYTASHTVTVNAGTGGEATTSATSVKEGSSYKITVTPNANYRVKTFTVNSVDKKSELQVSGSNYIYNGTMGTSNVTVKVEFELSQCTVTVGQSTNGSITVNGKGAGQTVSVNAGSAVTLTNTPDAGYKFDNYATTSGTVFKGNSYTVNSNVTIFGEFSKHTYNITDNSTNGSVTVTGGSSASTYQIGQTLTFTATPATGYSSNGKVTVNGEEYNSGDSITVDASMLDGITVEATFTANTYNVNVENVAGATVTVDKATAKANETVTVTVSTEAGYICNNITVDGKSYTVTNGKATFQMPAKDVTIKANVTVKITAPIITINADTTHEGVGSGYKALITPVVNIADDEETYVTIDSKSFTNIPTNAHIEEVTDANGVKQYYFYATAEGEYTLTYTAVIKSTLDNKTTATGTNTVTIKVSYSDIQKAYDNLKTTVDACNDVDSSKYDTSSDEWKAYENALNVANGLLSGGMPTAPSEDDISKTATYNNNVTALQTAYNNLAKCEKIMKLYVGVVNHITNVTSVKVEYYNSSSTTPIVTRTITSNALGVSRSFSVGDAYWSNAAQSFNMYMDPTDIPANATRVKVVVTGYVDNQSQTLTTSEYATITGNNTVLAFHYSNALHSYATNSEYTRYRITTNNESNGTITSDKTTAISGETVTITATPIDSTVVLDTVKVKASTGASIPVEVNGNKATFVMPAGDVTVTPVFKENITVPFKYRQRDKSTHNYTETTFNYSRDESGQLFFYKEITTSDDNLFTVFDGTTDYMFNDNNVYQKPSDEYINIGDHGVSVNNVNKKFAKTKANDGYYIIVYPAGYVLNGTALAKFQVCAIADLPGDDSFRVSINQGQSDMILNSNRGNSYLDGVVGNTTVKYDRETSSGLVEFRTDTKNLPDVNNAYKFKGYYQQVYGYHIVMEVEEPQADGTTKKVTKVTSLSGNQISSPVVGSYVASYMFPENVISADVTPVFVSSDAYLTEKKISTTNVYLKLTPGNNTLENTYEPNYYTWRANGVDAMVDVTLPDGTTANLSSDPEGAYPGQKLLYVGTDMYMAKVETALLGILFDDGNDGNTQTFDYNEFIKLQNLGYDNITFEVKESKNETTAAWMNTNKRSVGNKVYPTNTTETAYVTSSITTNEFYIDTNIEGYYIDVFGNKLEDENGNPILQKDNIAAVVADTTGIFAAATKESEVTTSLEIKKLFQTMGIDYNNAADCTSLYGARYGWYTETAFYGMEYAIRVYYFDHTTKMVSQQISGYGTIEGAISPKDGTMTNAEYAKDNLDGVTLSAEQGYRAAGDLVNFTTGYELIPETYSGVPYLVSYKIKTASRASTAETDSTYNRVDGKWYYQATIPQITVNMKTGLMDENDNLVMTDGVIIDQGTTYGTAFINGATSITVDQGTQAALSANAIEGYKFVGFYDKSGNLMYTNNPETHTVSLGTDIYAVFQKLGEGTLTVTNGVYRGTNPKDGEGNGIVGVELTIFNADGSVKETLKGVNSVTANITEGEGYQWKLTGKPTGVDKFIAFRQPEEQVDGTYYYSILDVEEYLSNDSNGMWTYAPDAVTEFDWDDYDTNSLSFNFVTDFQKVSVYARLNYHYRNRFNEPRTYTVNNILLSTEEIENKFTPSKVTIKKYAPPIDEVFTDCEWNVDGTGVLESGDSVANLTAIQTKKQFNTFILDEEVSPLAKKITAYYDSVIELNAADKDNFKYWKQYEIDSTGKKVGDGVIFSYDPTVSIRVSFNRYFEAVYEGEVVDVVTSVQDPLYTREKYTAEDGTVKDYIYVDFLLQFETCLDDSFKDFVKYSDYRVKYGIILERDTTVQYTAKDAEAGTKPADKAPTYDKRTYENVEAVVEKLGYNVADGGSTGGWTPETNTSDPEYNYYYNLFDLTNYADSLTSLGRIDYFLMFDNNVEVNRNHVYNVYSYVIYDTTIINDNGESEKVTKVVISTPKVMNIREIGDKTDGTT